MLLFSALHVKGAGPIKVDHDDARAVVWAAMIDIRQARLNPSCKHQEQRRALHPHQSSDSVLGATKVFPNSLAVRVSLFRAANRRRRFGRGCCTRVWPACQLPIKIIEHAGRREELPPNRRHRVVASSKDTFPSSLSSAVKAGGTRVDLALASPHHGQHSPSPCAWQRDAL